jgi:hypothetical protein
MTPIRSISLPISFFAEAYEELSLSFIAIILHQKWIGVLNQKEEEPRCKVQGVIEPEAQVPYFDRGYFQVTFSVRSVSGQNRAWGLQKNLDVQHR